MTMSVLTIKKALSALAAAVVVTGCSTAARHVEPVEAKVSNYAEFRTLISESVKEAEAKGQKEVHIHLKEDPHVVQPADLVEVDYTVTDPEGRLVYSTRQEKYVHMDKIYADLFGQAGSASGPETVLAGFAGVFPGAGHAVLGLRVGEHHKVEVPPENGFGSTDEAKIKTYARERVLPRTVRLPVDAFLKTFDNPPQIGREVRLAPYFLSRVTSVQDGVVILENLAADGETIDDDFGTTAMAVKDDRIIVTLDPEIGAAFETKDQKGIITDKDDRHFYVDFNHPLAATPLMYDVEVLDLKKFSTFEKMEIPWVDELDTAIELAAQEDKYLVLVLYAEWCQWSQRLLKTTFGDPRIKQYRDRLVWLKIDSDKERSYKAFFEQTGYPMIVLMDQQGEIVEKMSGFQDGGTLALTLGHMLEGDSVSPMQN